MTYEKRVERARRVGDYMMSIFLALVSAGTGGLMAWPANVNIAIIGVGLLTFVGWVAFIWRETNLASKEPPPPTEEQIGADLYALTQKPLVITIELTPAGRAAVMRFAVRKRVTVDQAIRTLFGIDAPSQ